jgi:23S rRNA G2069 N7-methylase RlmK/C1962 C5-methylase RlmI
MRIRDVEYVIPPDAEFRVDEAARCLNDLVEAGRKFDVIVMDPPWENKHVKREAARRRGYGMMNNKGKIPLGLNAANSCSFSL